ncbi:Pyruvate dehydrogenase (acetyl-transferring) kinase, mitochondrial [Porphyridium purpureum]|uniref:Protein-serine/threonine kinase n=1 Tax=Porphyridium purpureum TaxID=35688 RepID=A0A5J4YKZ0_PORPP|nr:Pyruvate dehydrogenase (acetyl-transferring) kinase, mitochondrial [Porphyridium purpureum]|eukprot:POR4133..scf249_10
MQRAVTRAAVRNRLGVCAGVLQRQPRQFACSVVAGAAQHLGAHAGKEADDNELVPKVSVVAAASVSVARSGLRVPKVNMMEGFVATTDNRAPAEPFPAAATASMLNHFNSKCPIRRHEVSHELAEQMGKYAARQPAPIPLRFLHEFGTLARSTEKRLLASEWLKEELPVRLARRVRELEMLPRKLCNMPSILRVRQTYQASFCDIVDFPALRTDADPEAKIRAFAALLEDIYARHKHVARDVACGLLEFREYNPTILLDQEEKLQVFLTHFFKSRIAIRLMIGHYLACFEEVPGFRGLINLKCRPEQRIRAAAEVVQRVARKFYCTANVPEVCIVGKVDAEFPYIDEFVYFCLREALKNAMRSMIEHHGDVSHAGSYPPIVVVIAEGDEDVSIRISDRGMGFPLRDMGKIFAFGYSTTNMSGVLQRLQHNESANVFDNSEDGPIAGLGYGLPLARLYATYFGGNMTVMSMEDWGTDVLYQFPNLERLGFASS